jgi:hypothetical protein
VTRHPAKVELDALGDAGGFLDRTIDRSGHVADAALGAVRLDHDDGMLARAVLDDDASAVADVDGGGGCGCGGIHASNVRATAYVVKGVL